MKARTALTAATLAFSLFFSDKVEALTGAGGNCISEPCDEGLYCVQEEYFIPGLGMRDGTRKMCVECMSDYDCPYSISCIMPLTPLAMCDWGAQKTFPGIDNIRKGYNGLKSDPLMYQDSSDPGWNTEGYLFDYDYMIDATAFTFNDELFDVPFGHMVNIDERCSFHMKTDMMSNVLEFEAASSRRVEQSSQKGDSGGAEVATAGRTYFSNANAKKETTSTTEAICNQYFIELDTEKLSQMKLDDHFTYWLKSQESKEKFDYYGLFDSKGTHFVTKAWLGSKFGMTNTITDESMKTVAGETNDYARSASGAVGGMFNGGSAAIEGSSSIELSISIATYSDKLNTFSYGSSDIASLEDWAAGSKDNPEIVQMKVDSICTLIGAFPQYGAELSNFTVSDCKMYAREYTNVARCYEITTKTCEVEYGGTDSELHLSIYGKHTIGTPKNIIGLYLNDKVTAFNAFEQGDVDTLTVCGEVNVGTIRQIGIRGGGDTWNPSWIMINGQTFSYDCAAVDYAELQAYPSNPLRTYDVTIQTCDVGSSGTDASIYLQLYGDIVGTVQTKSAPQYLNSLFSHNAFEAGSVETFKLIDIPDIGTITKVGVSGGWDTWTPLSISVDNNELKFSEDCPSVNSAMVYTA